MINTSMPRTGSSRVTTAPPAKIGFVCEFRSLAAPGSVNAHTKYSLGTPPTLGADQVLLQLKERLVVRIGGVRGPGTVRFQFPSRCLFVQGNIEQFADFGDMCGMRDGGKDLHPPVQVAVHEVRRAHPYRRLTAIGEPEQPAVLQKAAQNADDPDVLAQTWHTRADRADPSHPQVDGHPGLRSAVEGIGDRLVDKGVHFDPDSSRLAVFVIRDLIVDPV